MPLPWDVSRVRIPQVAERAITVKQLRELRSLVQQLTKTRLLKHTQDSDKQKGTLGQCILWDSLDLYDMTYELIKKVIPHVDPDGAGPNNRWYSWVEFVSSAPQPAKIMFSHWWGGRFNDFMAAVDHFVVDRALSVNTTFWICTFANCQFGEEFGAMLKECPFISTLRTVDVLALIVDFQAGSLKRTWCALEIHYAMEADKEFVLYTSAGRVGSSFVSGGPMVEAVREWDIRQTEASDPQYRRQILNYVAKENELQGLKKNAAGKMEVDSLGRPQLELGSAEPLEVDAVPRLTGEHEFAYEAKLFQKCARKFDSLNINVRLCVLRQVGDVRRHKGCSVPSNTHRGMTLNQLRIVTRRIEATCPWSPDTCSWETSPQNESPKSLIHTPRPVPFTSLTCHHVVQWIKHRVGSESRSCSYMELVSDGPQVPRYIFDTPWLSTWSDCMNTIELFAQANRLPDSTTLYVDLFCSNQIDDEAFRADFDNYKEGVVMDECEGCLRMVSTDVTQLARGWPWHTLDVAGRKGTNVYLGCAAGVLACNCPFANGAWIIGTFDPKLAHAVTAFDVRDIVCSRGDRDGILQRIKGNGDGISRFNNRIHCWCAGPLLHDAVMRNDVARVRAICSSNGLHVNSDSLKGTLGETPLHTAAALGNLEVLRVLLEGKMDPNMDDNAKDRPLHYAALAGQTASVRELLASRADPCAENSTIQRPLDVARLNPASFLGVDTEAIVKLLSHLETSTLAAAACAIAGFHVPGSISAYP